MPTKGERATNSYHQDGDTATPITDRPWRLLISDSFYILKYNIVKFTHTISSIRALEVFLIFVMEHFIFESSLFGI